MDVMPAVSGDEPVSRDMRAAIRLAAAALFAQRGYHATRMRDIAEAAGLSKASLYYYVQSKDDILFDLAVATVHDHLTAGEEALVHAGDHGFRALEVLISGHLGTLLAKPTSIALSMSDTQQLPQASREELAARRDEYGMLMRSVVEDGRSRSLLRSDMGADVLVLMLSSLLNGTLLREQSTAAQDVDDLARLLTPLYLDGVLLQARTESTPDSPGTVRRVFAQQAAALAQHESDRGSGSGQSAAITEVACVLFREKGFLATTTRDISRAAGVGNATLYHHVSDKEELLFLSYLHTARRQLAAVDEAVDAAIDTPERLRAFLHAHTATLLSDVVRSSCVVRNVRHLTGVKREQASALEDGYVGMLAAILRSGQAQGLVIDVDAQLLARILVSAANWTSLWFSPEGRWTPGDVADAFVAVMLGGASTSTSAVRSS